jgi:hypothetical protein
MKCEISEEIKKEKNDAAAYFYKTYAKLWRSKSLPVDDEKFGIKFEDTLEIEDIPNK